ncbi:MAG TPA: DegV family protein [Clostridia bacterium]|nr:DegV family protein [Clostridia bacterium]
MIEILTDSASDLSGLSGTLGVTVVPLTIIFPEHAYFDGELTREEFYEKLKNANPLPSTSQPSPADFLKYFERAKREGSDVIVITISEALSGTYQSAAAAKEMADYERIYLVDSRLATMGEAALVEYAAKLRAEGKSAEEIYETLLEARNRIKLFALVDTLTYLHRGGRLSKSVTVVGSFLNVKPILALENGVLVSAGKARGFSRGVEAVSELIKKSGGADFDLPVYFAHTNARELCSMFMEKLAELDPAFSCCERVVDIGGVVGTHVGEGTVGVAYFTKDL